MTTTPSPSASKVLLLLGGVLLGVGLVWIVVDRVLTRAAPDQWGGPNIGGGLLLLLSYIFVITGSGTALVGLLLRQRKR